LQLATRPQAVTIKTNQKLQKYGQKARQIKTKLARERERERERRKRPDKRQQQQQLDQFIYTLTKLLRWCKKAAKPPNPSPAGGQQQTDRIILVGNMSTKNNVQHMTRRMIIQLMHD